MSEERPKGSDIGEFTGNYAMEITTCSRVEENIPTNKRVRDMAHSNSNQSIPILRNWAATQATEHLESHEFWQTAPCQPLISSVCAVHKSLASPTRVVWVPLPNA